MGACIYKMVYAYNHLKTWHLKSGHLPSEIRTLKCPVFECFRVSNGRNSDPHCILLPDSSTDVFMSLHGSIHSFLFVRNNKDKLRGKYSSDPNAGYVWYEMAEIFLIDHRMVWYSNAIQIPEKSVRNSNGRDIPILDTKMSSIQMILVFECPIFRSPLYDVLWPLVCGI